MRVQKKKKNKLRNEKWGLGEKRGREERTGLSEDSRVSSAASAVYPACIGLDFESSLNRNDILAWADDTSEFPTQPLPREEGTTQNVLRTLT